MPDLICTSWRNSERKAKASGRISLPVLLWAMCCGRAGESCSNRIEQRARERHGVPPLSLSHFLLTYALSHYFLTYSLTHTHTHTHTLSLSLSCPTSSPDFTIYMCVAPFLQLILRNNFRSWGASSTLWVFLLAPNCSGGLSQLPLVWHWLDSWSDCLKGAMGLWYTTLTLMYLYYKVYRYSFRLVSLAR